MKKFKFLLIIIAVLNLVLGLYLISLGQNLVYAETKEIQYNTEEKDNKNISYELTLPQRNTRNLNQFQQYYNDFTYEDVIAMNVKFCIQGTITKEQLVTFLYNVFNVNASNGINSYYNLKIDCPILVYNNSSSSYISNWLYVSSITYYVDNTTPSNSYIRFVTNGYNNSGVVTNSAYTEFTNSYTLNQIDNLTLTLYKVNNSNFINYINFSQDNTLNSNNLFQYNETATFDNTTNTINYTYANYSWNNHYNYINNNVFSSMFIESTDENLPITIGTQLNNLVDTIENPGNSTFTTNFTYTFNDNNYPDKIKIFKTYTNTTIYNYINGTWTLQTFSKVRTLPILLILREPIVLETPYISINLNTISWQAIENATGYEIYMDGTLQATTSSTQWVTITNGTYQVKAITNLSGYSDSELSNSIVQNAYNDIIGNGANFYTLIGSIMDSEIYLIKSLLNYTVWGINFFDLFKLFITACLIIIIIKLALKNKG